MQDTFGRIKIAFAAGRAYYSRHARKEMLAEEFGPILDLEVSQIVASGEIIKEYPDDKPYPSMLILGFTSQRRPIHIVTAYVPESDTAIIITVYEPDPKLWTDFRTKRDP